MYDLHELGWSSFQQLCLTIAREVLGQTVESFLDSNDGGRDGAFTGTWRQSGQEDLRGRFVIQCKFTSKPNVALQPSDLSDETPKAAQLVKQGLCDSYVLMTNAGVSGRSAARIRASLIDVGVQRFLVLDSGWIRQQIRENKRLRMLVPRVYGIGDLSQILDERAYAQARAVLDWLREDLSKVVVTDAYHRAASALDAHGFVLLVGEPAAGKTTIASMLAMSAVDMWDAPMLKLDDPRKIVDHWNPEEPGQFFWLDDAFGITQLEASLVYGWNHILPQIQTMLRMGAKIVMTSRDYIYNRARRDLKESSFPLFKESQVVIDVHALTDDEKRQILYNHLRLGKQPRAFRALAKPHLEAIATHPRFVPEIARRLADPIFTQSLHLDTHSLAQFVEKRESLLKDIIQGLDSNSKAALAVVYMRNDKLESPVVLDDSEVQAIERLGSNFSGCVAALEALKDSLVLHSHLGDESIWRFKHPTVGDAFSNIVTGNPELLEVFIRGSAPNKLIRQITCGDVGFEKATIIPRSLFPLVLSKLPDYSRSASYKSDSLSAWNAHWSLGLFLARRCSKEFLTLYIESHPDLLDQVSTPGLSLPAAPEVDLAVRLHQFALLPEANRLAFVAQISEYAVRGDDLLGLIDSGIRTVFHESEFDRLLQDVRRDLLPNLANVRRDFQNDWRSDEPAWEYLQPLIESFEILLMHFGEHDGDRATIEREACLANEWAAESAFDEPSTQPRDLGMAATPLMPRGARSIFDDVDA